MSLINLQTNLNDQIQFSICSTVIVTAQTPKRLVLERPSKNQNCFGNTKFIFLAEQNLKSYRYVHFTFLRIHICSTAVVTAKQRANHYQNIQSYTTL